MTVLAEPPDIKSTSIGVRAVRVSGGCAMIVASGVIVSSRTAAWTTVDNVDSSGSDLHGGAAMSSAVVLIVASCLLVFGRLTATACVTGVLASSFALLAAWTSIWDARQVPADAGDATIRVVIHPALWHTVWAADGALAAALAISTIELVNQRRRRVRSF